MGRANWPVSAVRSEAIGGAEINAKSRQRLAWTILISAFAVFVALLITTPLAVRWYLARAASPQEATLEVNSGTVPVIQVKGAAPLAVAEGSMRNDIKEGAEIRTDTSSQAFLTLFNHSTVVIFPNTVLRLRRMRAPRFSMSERPLEVSLEILQGRVRVGVAPAVARPTNTVILTPHGQATLQDGSYAVEVTDDETQLVGPYRGIAGAVWRQGNLAQPGRTSHPSRKSLSGRATSRRTQPCYKWKLWGGARHGSNADRRRAGSPLAGLQRPGVVMKAKLTAQHRWFLWATALLCVSPARVARTTTGRRALSRKINKDVSDYLSIKLRADIKLTYQNLSGGGDQSSEYPVIIRVNYKDVYGHDNSWTHGFYYQNVGGKPTQHGQRIPPNVWYSYEEPNLKEKLTNPKTITSLQIYASGWDYDSQVSEIGIIAE